MRQSSKFFIAACLSFAVGGAAALDGSSARAGEGRHHGGGWHGPKVMKRFDANRDGKLTQDEINAVRANRLSRFDSDGDGRLTLQEYEALWLDAMRERMVDRFQFLDNDGDGAVTRDEFVDPFAWFVARKDRNGDGELSVDELMRRRGEHHRRREQQRHRR